MQQNVVPPSKFHDPVDVMQEVKILLHFEDVL